jgi:hypothetical protein
MRIRGYQKLMLYLIYMALYVPMLYVQRDASNSHKVHSTIQASLVPSTPVNSIMGIYDYLEHQTSLYWRDPICGDGMCDSPFEFPSYGRFGCTADCGFLKEAVQLQPVQVRCLSRS